MAEKTKQRLVYFQVSVAVEAPATMTDDEIAEAVEFEEAVVKFKETIKTAGDPEISYVETVKAEW